MSTGLKLQSLMSVDLIASMGKEYVMKNVLHRFKSVFFDSSTILFRQGDVIQESSPIYILANGQVKVLVDPNFKPVSDDTEEVKMVATTEATGCRYAQLYPIVRLLSPVVDDILARFLSDFHSGR